RLEVGASDLGEGVGFGAETAHGRPSYGTAPCEDSQSRWLRHAHSLRRILSLKRNPIPRSRYALLRRRLEGGASDLGEGVGFGAETAHGRPGYGTAPCED